MSERAPEKKVEKRKESRSDNRRRASRLDLPLDVRRSRRWRREPNPDAFGVFAERFARFMGTARFLAYMTGFVIVWISLNLVGLYGLDWDPYPFILLNLIFSTQASYAAPLILLAQNRQEDRDRVITEQDRQANARAHADMEFLAREVASLRMAIGEVATRDFLRSELRSLLQDLEEGRNEEPPEDRGESEKRHTPRTSEDDRRD